MNTWETSLKITRASDGLEIVFPSGSEFGVSVDLATIGEAINMRRTVNATLKNLADPAFRKYAFTITASGFVLPTLEGIWEGERFTVECPVSLREVGGSPSRPAVAGSVKVVGGTVEYMPVFDALLVGKSQNEEEGKASASWSLDFEEV